MNSRQEFCDTVEALVAAKINRKPSKEECKAVAHHMEYNMRTERHFANNGEFIIDEKKIWKGIVGQIKYNFHDNDLKDYLEQYRAYKKLQRRCDFTMAEKSQITDIATGKKQLSDFTDKDSLQTTYIKYLNQVLMPEIKKISMQEKNNLGYHGLWHTEQVAMLSIDIAIRENHNPLPILIAAALHDCARTTDSSEPDHGKNCKPIAEAFLQTFSDCRLLSKQEKDKIVEAVVYHNSLSRPRNNHILDCLQDADSMRLFWKERQNFEPNTATGKKLSMHFSRAQTKYLAPLIEKMQATKPVPLQRRRTKSLTM